MKKLLTFVTATAGFIPAVAAHYGLSHAYNGTRVSLLILLLWLSLAVYQELGDTVKGHWVLFSGVFIAFYVPVVYPHTPITGSMEGMVSVVLSVLLIGGVTFLRHRLWP